MMATTSKHPPIQQGYTARTNQGFLLQEAGLVATRLLAGATKEALRRDVMDNDLFQLAAAPSRKTALGAVQKRLEGASPELLAFLSEGSLELRRLTNLYLILLQHRLLREFIAEVVLEALGSFSYALLHSDVSAFMVRKRSQVPVIEGWSEATLFKSRTNLVNVCVSAGLLQRVTGKLSILPQQLPPALREELVSAQREGFLRLLLDSEVI
jgi:hypothetical protein